MVVFNDWHHGIRVMDTMDVQNGGFWFSLGWHGMGLYRCLLIVIVHLALPGDFQILNRQCIERIGKQ